MSLTLCCIKPLAWVEIQSFALTVHTIQYVFVYVYVYRYSIDTVSMQYRCNIDTVSIQYRYRIDTLAPLEADEVRYREGELPPTGYMPADATRKIE